MIMEESILRSVRKALGTELYDGFSDEDPFNEPILLAINSTLATLHQLGVGPQNGFEVTDNSQTWADFCGSDNVKLLGFVKNYVAMKVRLKFDPPTSGALKEAVTIQADELEWRILEELETFSNLA